MTHVIQTQPVAYESSIGGISKRIWLCHCTNKPKTRGLAYKIWAHKIDNETFLASPTPDNLQINQKNTWIWIRNQGIYVDRSGLSWPINQKTTDRRDQLLPNQSQIALTEQALFCTKRLFWYELWYIINTIILFLDLCDLNLEWVPYNFKV